MRTNSFLNVLPHSPQLFALFGNALGEFGVAPLRGLKLSDVRTLRCEVIRRPLFCHRFVQFSTSNITLVFVVEDDVSAGHAAMKPLVHVHSLCKSGAGAGFASSAQRSSVMIEGWWYSPRSRGLRWCVCCWPLGTLHPSSPLWQLILCGVVLVDQADPHRSRFGLFELWLLDFCGAV